MFSFETVAAVGIVDAGIVAVVGERDIEELLGRQN